MRNLPTGCLLIKMTVFDKITKPWFSGRVEGEHIIGEDMYFCECAAAAGLEIWQDVALSQEVGHIGERVFRLGETWKYRHSRACGGIQQTRRSAR